MPQRASAETALADEEIQTVKQWVQKLVDQLYVDWNRPQTEKKVELSEERATVLFLLDVYNKHLMDIEKHPVRKTRETLDTFAKEIFDLDEKKEEMLFFRIRQFFSSYRIDEYSYLQTTFDDFKKIIWDFADQLGEEVREERAADVEVESHLTQLREAVESNSIDALRSKSREFIDSYIRHQSKKDERRSKRMAYIRKNLNSVKKKLVVASQTATTDHLTGAFNRRAFDEQIKNQVRLHELGAGPMSLIVLDIDHFKKVNDTFGHDMGDCVIKECVRFLKETFTRDLDFVARIGGEEFAVILPEYRALEAVKKAEEALTRIRREVFVNGKVEIKFTVSMGIAQLQTSETWEQWLKRADQALYQSKHSGRDRYTVADAPSQAGVA